MEHRELELDIIPKVIDLLMQNKKTTTTTTKLWPTETQKSFESEVKKEFPVCLYIYVYGYDTIHNNSCL